MLVLGVVALATKDRSDTTRTMVVHLVPGSIGVGFCEELGIRGAAPGGAAPLTERLAWFWATLASGCCTSPTPCSGAGPAAISQVGLAFASGSTLHLLRRGAGAPRRCSCTASGTSRRSSVTAAMVAGCSTWPWARSVVLAVVPLTRRDRDAATLAPYAVAHPVAT